MSAARALAAFGLLALAIIHALPPLPQDEGYHAFADDRTFLGVPHFLNVVSNLPFILVGIVGLVATERRRLPTAERWPARVLFLGVLLTGFGSSYYHWDPDSPRLVWDRLPMTVAFMGFFALMLADRVDARAGLVLLGPLVLLGVASVVNWRRAGDLRLYVLVQLFPLVATLGLLALVRRGSRGDGHLWAGLAWYGLAKVVEAEALDHGIFALGGVVGGHTLKHLAAAAGAWCLVRFVQSRGGQSQVHGAGVEEARSPMM